MPSDQTKYHARPQSLSKFTCAYVPFSLSYVSLKVSISEWKEKRKVFSNILKGKIVDVQHFSFVFHIQKWTETKTDKKRKDCITQKIVFL